MLVLASSSRYRRELLARLELPFQARSPDFDERTADHRFDPREPLAFAELLAAGKAESLRADFPDAWILAADQLAVVTNDDGTRELLHKPETPTRAVEQLMRLSGRTHELISAVVLMRSATGTFSTATDQQCLTMRAFDRTEASAYVERWAPLDCCGAYRIEDAGIKLFDRIEGGDFTGIMGLPLFAVARLLRSAGLLS